MKKTLTVLLLLFTLLGSVCHAEALEWITVAENAVLPDEVVLARAYPASVTLGESLCDLPFLLDTLLGEGWYQEERSEWDSCDTYRSASGDDPWEWRTIRVYDEDRSFGMEEFSYYNPWITGERGGEYEAPKINLSMDESEVLCRALLQGIVPEEWLIYSNPSRNIRDRWTYSDRWMTNDEYFKFCAQQQSHYHTFNAVTQMGVPIQSERIFAHIGLDGLSGLSINYHAFTESEEYILPMTLEEAFALANSTRSAPCNLIGAQLIYSNWLTDSDTHNLSWYLLTDRGSYVVDCVLKKHRCDSYEY